MVAAWIGPVLIKAALWQAGTREQSGTCAKTWYRVPMEEPSPHSSRLALAGGLAAILIVGGGGFFLGRSTTERPTVVAGPAPAAVPVPTPTPAPEEKAPAILGRNDLVALAASAADAASSGAAAPPDVVAAAGRRFAIRLPFGCNGPAAEGSDAPMRWRYDAEEGVLRIHVSRIAWTAQDWGAAAAPANVAAVEGFWIPRPWSSSEACPAPTDQSQVTGIQPVTLPGQTLAVAQFFAADGAEPGRRESRPFETSMRLAPDAFDAARGFALRLTGRVARAPGEGPVLCRQPGGAEQRPICVIAVTIDEAAILNPASGETLATWDVDRQETAGP